MIGIHQSVARRKRRLAIMRGCMVAGVFVLLAGIGVIAGMVQSKTPSDATTRPAAKVQTPSQEDFIPPPTYNNSAAGADTATDTPEVQGATTAITPPTPAPRASSGPRYSQPPTYEQPVEEPAGPEQPLPTGNDPDPVEPPAPTEPSTPSGTGGEPSPGTNP